MSKLNWNYKEVKNGATEEVGFTNIEAKPYIVKILGYEDREDKQSLKLYLDIAHGELKDYFKEQHDQFGGDWDLKGVNYVSYKDSAKYFFAAFTTSLEKSNSIEFIDKLKDKYPFLRNINSKFIFDDEKDWEKQIKGKYIVVNYGPQEYISKDVDDNGKRIIKVSIMPQEFRSIVAFDEGKIKPLKLRKLTAKDFEFKGLTENDVVYEDKAVVSEKKEEVDTGNFNNVEDDLPF